MKSAALVILISPGNKEVTRSNSRIMWNWIHYAVKVSMTGYVIKVPERGEELTVNEFMENYAPANAASAQSDEGAP